MPEITITAGILPPPACYATEQERLEAYVGAMSAELTSDREWSVGQIPPVDMESLWLKLDVNGRPVMAFAYNDADAAWVPWFGFPISGVSTGAAGNYSLTNSPAFTTTDEAYQIGRTFVFKANHATTGPSTLNIDGLGAKAIKIRVTQDTTLGTILIDQIVTVVYDGTNFQMVSAVGGASIQVGDIVAGTDGQTLRTRDVAAVPTTVWEKSYYKTTDAAAVAIPAATVATTFNHGLGQRPITFGFSLLCIDPDQGFSISDEIPIANTSIFDTTGSDQVTATVWADVSVIGLMRGLNTIDYRIANKATGVQTEIDPTKWKLIGWATK